jgi:phosphoribosylaminoimidazole-succinocarboxamide synthase
VLSTAPVLETSLDGLTLHRRGKVRDVYEVTLASGAPALLMIATDRISAFDYVLGSGIPDKGKVLTQLSGFWFERLGDLVPHHLISMEVDEFPPSAQRYAGVLRGRTMLTRVTDPIPVECVARGYLSGSGWKEYQQHGAVCGITLPAGLRESDRLPEPIFTPATKAESGHDINIPYEEAGRIVGRDLIARLRELTLEIYHRGCEHAESRGIIIADTKFEFGLARRSAAGAEAGLARRPSTSLGTALSPSKGRSGGSSASFDDIDDSEIVLIDEVLTPDSSRFWPRASYTPGHAVPSFDKQFVRDYLEEIRWNKQPPVPTLPDEVVRKTREKYIEAFRLLSGRELR